MFKIFSSDFLSYHIPKVDIHEKKRKSANQWPRCIICVFLSQRNAHMSTASINKARLSRLIVSTYCADKKFRRREFNLFIFVAAANNGAIYHSETSETFAELDHVCMTTANHWDHLSPRQTDRDRANKNKTAIDFYHPYMVCESARQFFSPLPSSLQKLMNKISPPPDCNKS